MKKCSMSVLILALTATLLITGCSNEGIPNDSSKEERLKLNIELEEEVLLSGAKVKAIEDKITINQIKVNLYEGNNITGNPIAKKVLEEISGNLAVVFEQVKAGKKYTLDVKVVGKLDGNPKNRVLYQGSKTSGKLSTDTITTLNVTAKPLPAKNLEVNIRGNEQVDKITLMHPGTKQKITKEDNNSVNFKDVRLNPAEWILKVLIGEDSLTKEILLLPTESKSIELEIEYNEDGKLEGNIIVPTSPAAPKNLKLDNNNNLIWDSIEEATAYSIYRSSDNDVDTRKYLDTVRDNSYQGIEDGYYYWVRAYRNQFSGNISDSYLAEIDDDKNGKGLVVEAEYAELKGFNIKDDEGASNGKYISSDYEDANNPDDAHKAVFKFEVEKAGRYRVRARTSSQGKEEGANSFFLQVNGKTSEFHLDRTEDWQYNDSSKSYLLDEGVNKVVIYAREKGTCLDKLELVPHDQGEWYKSKSESVIRAEDGGIRWSPVKKPTTIHRYFDPVQLEVGDTITFSMNWESDGRDGSAKEIDGANSDPTNQGEGISDDYLRCLAGTGDFRVGFFQSDEKVGNGTKDGPDGNSASRKFNEYKGFQFRMHPHLSAGFRNKDARLIEEHDDGREESHINISLWTRYKPGKYGLMSDEAQEYDHSGFSKGDDWGTQPQSWGPNLPFGEARDLIVKVKMVSDIEYEVTVTLNGHTAPLLTGRYSSDFKPDFFDTIAITYTNQSRRYEYVKITDFKVEKNDNDDNNEEENCTVYTFDNTNSDKAGTSRAKLMGGAGYSSIAKVGSHSINLNGNDDYLELPKNLANTEDFTFAAWLKWDIISDWQRIFSAGKDTDNTMFLTPQASDGKLRFRIESNGNKQVIKTDYEVKADTWEHVAVTLNGDTGKIYINGELVKAKSNITYNPNDLDIENFWLGKSHFDDPNLNGRLDDVRIYNYSLSESEIKNLSN